MALYTFFSGMTDDEDILLSILSDIYDECGYENVQIIKTKDFKIQDKILHSLIGQSTDKDNLEKIFIKHNYHWVWFDSELPSINNLDAANKKL